MRRIKEVLRLRYELGLGQRHIARSCSISQSTVNDYLRRAEAAGLRWPLKNGMMTGSNKNCSVGRRYHQSCQRRESCRTLHRSTISSGNIGT